MKKVTVFLILINIFSLWAQTARFRHLSLEDGLSQSTVNCIYQDGNGYMWFGTQDGLNRYDGYQFNVFRENPVDTNSVSHSWIWSVFEDRDGMLWIATWNGLTKYDPSADRYVRYFPNPDDPRSIGGARPTSICQDAEGNLWIGTWGGGLSKYIYEKDHFETYVHNPQNENSIPSNFIRSLFYENDTLWVGTWGGLAKIQIKPGGKLRIVNFYHDSKNSGSISCNKITSVIRDAAGVLWIGTFGGGINKFNSKTKTFTAITQGTDYPLRISHDDVSVVYEDRSRNLWIGTLGGGLNKIDKYRKKVYSYSNEPDNAASLSGNKIYSILEDKAGLIWIGSNGIDIYNKHLERFSHFKCIPNNKNSLTGNKVWAFYEDHFQNIWIGTEGGLNKYNPVDNRFVRYTHIAGNPASLGCDQVSSLTSDGKGNLWICTRGGGLNRLDPATGKFKSYNHLLENAKMEGFEYLMSACSDNNILWLATYDRGLIKYDTRLNTFEQFLSVPSDENSISGNYLSVVYKDSREHIWVGTWGTGLNLYDKESKHFKRYLHKADDPTSLASNIVHCIYEYKNGKEAILYIGTNNGLSYIDLNRNKEGSFGYLSEVGAFPSRVIYGILADDNDDLWISTNNGLIKFNLRTRDFKSYTTADGLQSNEFNASACLKRENGQLLFGGVNGFNMFFPDSIKDNRYKPPIVVTCFKVFDQPYVIQKSNRGDRVHLSYEQNFFSFELAALDYSKPGKNQYAYTMKGFDKNWIYSGTRHFASYTNLDPGTYKFKAKGTNGDGVWNNKAYQVLIVIDPPLWQTWWFRLLAAILLTVLFYGLYKYRVTKLLEIERLRVRIASDLHDDIGSALTRISVYSETIQITKDKNKIKGMSKKIGVLSREIIGTMSDVVWSIDARNDLTKNLLDRMKDFAANHLVEKDIQLVFTHKGLDPDKKISVNTRQNLFLIFKEAINNIVKHSAASRVKVVLVNSKNNFRMIITDNGTGFNIDTMKKGNGIKNMKMRAERIGAELSIKADNGVDLVLIMRKI